MIRLSICVEEMQKPRDLKQMARPIAQPSQLQLRVALTRVPECLDQRSDPGAVDIGQLRHIDRERRQGLPFERRMELFA
jgi:hypothetical protein